MNIQLQYNHIAIPLTISLVLIVALIILGLRQRQNPIATPYLTFMFCLLIWMTTSLLEILILNLELSLLVADLSFLGITFLPVAWLAVVMIYTGKSKRLNRLLPWLIIIPILTNLFIWTNPLHHLWRGDSYRDLTTTWFPLTIYDYGSWFTVHLIFSLTMTFAAEILLLRSLFFKEKAYRTQIIFLLVALNLPLCIEILHRFGLQPIAHYNLTTLVFPISGLLLGWVLLRFRFLDLTPIARDLVVESMEDLMLVLDDKGRLIDVNPSARHRLFQGNMGVVGLYIGDLMPDQSELVTWIMENNYFKDEVDIRHDGKLNVYEVSISPIRRKSGEKAGRLVLLRDITGRKHAETAIYEQVQKNAVLEERQRLARDLHDSVNQTLFAAQMLADLLPRAIEKKPEKVPEYALNIQQLIHGTSAEMRLVLLELYPDALTQTDLGTIIKHLCDAYTGSTGTLVNFTATAQIHLENDAQIAFYRIAQEAFNNISKHTEATQVTVKLTRRDDMIQLFIQDNGAGFEINDTPSDHFGLANMIERASSVGAELSIDSKLDIGTTITVIRGAS